ncbi:MAG: class I SAM-dependent methyltransferase [Deltaproteobacteria bacterium]|nr:class I SAM-dependent methyltransferase [Deltaproteobacteria bacterium]
MTSSKSFHRHALYERAVQSPAFTLRFVEQVYKRAFGTSPMSLREDFCGTALVACDFVRSHPQRRALGVDFNDEVLRYGEESHLDGLDDEEKCRIDLMQADVRFAQAEAPFDFVDVVIAENFSYNVFHTEEELLQYFVFVHSNLQDEGMFILDVMGGNKLQLGAQKDQSERGDLQVVWEQKDFDPITHRARFELHFALDGQTWTSAFYYDWRLWTLPELKFLLEKAGFSDVDVYFEADGKKEGSYRVAKKSPPRDSFVAMLTARR